MRNDGYNTVDAEVGGIKRIQPKTALKVLYWSLVVAGAGFAYMNISPYQKASVFILNGLLKWVVSNISGNPGVLLVFLLSWGLGIALWLIIQIIEVLPLILFNHAGFLSFFIGASQGHQRYQVSENDDPTLKLLKRTYNALPTSVISNLETLKVFTYVVDFCICLTVYSPVKSGKVTDFIFYLSTGQWTRIQWDNVLLALATLFAIEIIISLIIWVGKLAFAFKKVQAQEQF